VPTWTTIKLQLALISRHRLHLKAFDCVAAYLKADLKDPLYVYTPKGLMQELGQDPNKIWKLNKALYRWPPSGRIWFDEVFMWLHNSRVSHTGTWQLWHLDDAGSTRFTKGCWWHNLSQSVQ